MASASPLNLQDWITNIFERGKERDTYQIFNFYTLWFVLLKVSAGLSEAVHGLEVLGHAHTAGPLLHHTLHLARHIVEANHVVQLLQGLLYIWW